MEVLQGEYWLVMDIWLMMEVLQGEDWLVMEVWQGKDWLEEQED